MKSLLLLVGLVSGSAAAADLAAGWTHSAAIHEGRVWSWGDNAYGQLGQPDAGRALRPRPVAGVRHAVAVAASWHTLALTAEGHVYAWGRNTRGQLGNGRFGIEAREPSPVRVEGLEGIVAIAAGWEHSLALAHDGSVYAWGSRSHGQLGDGARETGRPAAAPLRVAGLSGIRAIAAGGQHSLALREDGTLLAWGGNWNGQLGNGRRGAGTHSAVPQPVTGPGGKGALTNVTGLAAGGLHSVAVTSDGTVFAWGYNGTGQVAEGSRGGFWEDQGRRDVASPAPGLAGSGAKRAPLAAAAAAAAGFESTYALTGAGEVLAAGWSLYGELGAGATGGGNRDTFGPVLTGRAAAWTPPGPGTWRPELAYRYTDRGHADKGVTDLELRDAFKGPPLVAGRAASSGSRHARLARNADNVEVQADLAYPAQAEVGRPVEVVLTKLTFGMHEGDDDFATRVRLLWRCDETGETSEIPLDVGARAGGGVLPPLAGVVALASGAHHALARDRSGALWAWGHNGFGQLGDGGSADGAVARKLAAFDEAAKPLPPAARKPAAADATPPPDGAVNVRERGAAGDGIALDQAALQRAVDEVAGKGGGTVWLPPGTYLTGTLELRDGVRLHLSEGATLLASGNREHFSRQALIYAAGVRGIALTGKGVLDGRGRFVGARDWRHHVLLMENCRDVRVEGVSTVNAGSWTQHYIRCLGLAISGVTVRSLLPGRNNDGIDLSGCEEVRIEGCTVISDDDAIVIKSQSADRVNRAIRVVGNRCHTYRGAFKLGTETRGAYADIVCRDLTCYGAKAIELYSVDGSETAGITVENVRAYDALVALNIRLGARLRPSYWAKGLAPKVGHLRDIRIRNVEADIAYRSWRELLLEHGIPDAEWATGKPESPYDSCISGLPGHRVENVVIEGLKVRVPGGETAVRDAAALPERPEAYPHAGNFGVLPAHGLFVRHARNVTVKGAHVQTARPDVRPPVASSDVEGFVVEGLKE
jgi:alpha-tubulin suppressor-like RCC1 family protein